MINFPLPQTGTRYPEGAYDETGIWRQPEPETLGFFGNVQAVSTSAISQADLERMSELGIDSLDGLVMIMSNVELFTARKPGYLADRINHRGQVYEVKSSNYAGILIPHYESLAQLVDEKTANDYDPPDPPDPEPDP